MGKGREYLIFERRGGELTIAAELEPPEEALSGARCCKCLTKLARGELFGVFEGRVLCAECVDEEWNELTAAEKLEILGYDIKH